MEREGGVPRAPRITSQVPSEARRCTVLENYIDGRGYLTSLLKGSGPFNGHEIVTILTH